MKTTWLKGLNVQKKEAMRLSFSASADLRERLKAIAEEKVAIIHKKRITDASYESPNWAFQQADLCGYERAMEEIISLLSE